MTNDKKKPPSADPKSERRSPNPSEAKAIDHARAAHDNRPARAQVARKEGGSPTALALGATHSDDVGGSLMLYDTFASSADDFVNASLFHLAQLTARGSDFSMTDLNAALAIIGAIAPQNELEAALAAQMAATHDLSLMILRKAKGADRIDHLKEYGNIATKLQRTFTMQMKALSDWRRGGEQVVRHIHVHEGGQAVVAETVMVGASNGNGAFKPHEQSALGPSLLGYDQAGNGVPVSSDQGQEAMQAPRRPVSRGRRASGKP